MGLYREYRLGVAGTRRTNEERECGLAKAEEFRSK